MWVKYCTGCMNEWFTHLMNESKHREVPMLFVRFEDLLINPEPELRNIMRFLLGEPDIKGTNAERRIYEIL